MNARALAPHYSRFRVAERILLTGHSHQAWPDVGFAAQQQAWLDAADFVDGKWERAEQVADEVRAGYRVLLNDADGDIALGQNTHELVARWLSAVLAPDDATAARRTLQRGAPVPSLSRTRMTRPTRTTTTAPARSFRPVRSRRLRGPRLLTTDAEFHTIRRQLDRLEHAGLMITRVPARPVATLAERMAQSVGDETAAVLMSSVLFETAEIVPNLARVAERCELHGAELLVDAYHHLNVVPFDIQTLGLGRAYITGGGYKYCQLGEGNGFLRVPPDCTLQPVITGWFSEFAALADSAVPGGVVYGKGAARFAGATYDPTSHYRAAAVFAFHREMQLTSEALRSLSLHQVGLLERQVESLDLDPAVAALVDLAPEERGGFLAIVTPQAASLVPALRAGGLWADARGSYLRLGPAPYVTDEQLSDAVEILRASLKAPNPSD